MSEELLNTKFLVSEPTRRCLVCRRLECEDTAKQGSFIMTVNDGLAWLCDACRETLAAMMKDYRRTQCALLDAFRPCYGEE